MRVLLDTYHLYRFMTRPGEFLEPERSFFDKNDVQVHVSAVSIWEMRLKYQARHVSGQRKSPFDPKDVLAMLEGHGVTFLPVEAHHAASALTTPIPHKDPFDELLLVQAQEEGLRLLTSDRHLRAHPLAVTV